MKTSRRDGILTFNTNKPYKMAIKGNLEDRSEIICHDVTSACEGAAFDIEQMLLAALYSVQEKQQNKAVENTESIDNQDNFYNDDSPSEQEINDQANMLEMMFKMNTEVKTSELMDAFKPFFKAGVICCAGDQRMHDVVWKTVNRNDKLKIVFRYCAFFANPLESLLTLAVTTESQGSSEVNAE